MIPLPEVIKLFCFLSEKDKGYQPVKQAKKAKDPDGYINELKSKIELSAGQAVLELRNRQK